MGKWFQKFGPGKKDNKMVLEGEVASATRALYQGVNQLPRIQFKFKVRHGYDEQAKEQFSEVEIEMDLFAAGKFIDEALSAYHAAMPRMPRTSRQTQYGE